MITDSESAYFQMTWHELHQWQLGMSKKPSILNKATKGFQKRINRIIPEKVHRVITKAIKEITRAVLFGAGFKAYGSQNKFCK